jgi:acyl-CoA synthetase (AMP-forming)/AMP-acid ligase II
MSTEPPPSNLVALLRSQAERRGDDPLFTFLLEGEVDGAVDTLTYAELFARARAVAARLQGAVAEGERVLLIYPPGLDFVAAFFGCLLARVVAVPAYPPDPARLERTLPRLRAIVRDAQARLALTTSPLLAIASGLFSDVEDLASLSWLATDDAGDPAASWRAPEISGDDVAFLQYTSGSTGAPKGVMVTHKNLLHNLGMLQIAAVFSPSSVWVSWLPQYHDMGLITGLLLPLYVGIRAILMSPLAFLQNPLRWLRAITRFRGTHSGAPNFAYDLCARKARPSTLAELDLSSWHTAFNAAEPVRAETLERFAQTFGPRGLRREALAPCYGLAEVTVVASVGRIQGRPALAGLRASALRAGRVEDATSDDRQILASCGPSPVPEHEILIVDPETRRRCLPDRIGEIWLRSPSVARGYWNRPEETREIFHATLADEARPGDEGPFLRTGDLGFLRGGELYVTGRRKDVIIINGINYAPQDIELTAERSHAAIRPGCVAAFAVNEGGAERLGVVAEIDPRQEAPPEEVIAAIRRAVHERHELPVRTGALLSPGGLPKTSSGKLQRHTCHAALGEGALPVVARFEGSAIPT